MFDKALYGKELRAYRSNLGFSNADDFLSSLKELGLSIQRSALYRIERGEQNPNIEFILAVNYLFFGDAFSSKILLPCINEPWCVPNDVNSEDAYVRALDPVNEEQRLEERVLFYEEIMNGISAYDFDVFPNARSDEDHLYMSVAFGPDGEGDFEFLSASEIRDESDIERGIILFLKRYGFDLPGTEIVKLVDYGKEKVLPELRLYQFGQNAT